MGCFALEIHLRNFSSWRIRGLKIWVWLCWFLGPSGVSEPASRQCGLHSFHIFSLFSLSAKSPRMNYCRVTKFCMGSYFTKILGFQPKKITYAESSSLMSMGGRTEGLVGTDPGARTHIEVSRNLILLLSF